VTLEAPTIQNMMTQNDLGEKTVNNTQQLAYKTGNSQTTEYRTYRHERGKPVYRRGVQVVVVPQFKGLTLWSPTTSNAAPFTHPSTNTAIVRIPAGPHLNP